MANARTWVGPPQKEALEYGLFSVAENRGSSDNRWQNGVTWGNVCPDGDSWYDRCIQANALNVAVTGIAAPPEKAATAERSFWGATPFTVKVQIDCSPPGFYDDADEFVRTAFDQAEPYEVEQVFFTGTVGGTPNLQFPHLSSGGELTEDGVTLQLSAGNLGPTGGGSLDVVEALGRLENALSACVRGKGVIHISCELLPHLRAQHLVYEEGGKLYTVGGHNLAVSAAYTGSNPSGVIQVGVSWMYGTGPVFIYKSNPKFVGTEAQSLDRDVNTLHRIYERTYVIGYDCCLFAVPVSTGGVVTGSINSAS